MSSDVVSLLQLSVLFVGSSLSGIDHRLPYPAKLFEAIDLDVSIDKGVVPVAQDLTDLGELVLRLYGKGGTLAYRGGTHKECAGGRVGKIIDRDMTLDALLRNVEVYGSVPRGGNDERVPPYIPTDVVARRILCLCLSDKGAHLAA